MVHLSDRPSSQEKAPILTIRNLKSTEYTCHGILWKFEATSEGDFSKRGGVFGARSSKPPGDSRELFETWIVAPCLESLPSDI